MAKGESFQDEVFRYQDAFSGREVVRLTNYFGHSNHLYFTDPCWFNEGRSMVFTSDREGRSNLYAYNLDSFTITQLTDLESDGPARPTGCFSEANQCHYFLWKNQILELNIKTLEERVVYEVPDGISFSNRTNPTADGKYLLSRTMRDEGPKQPQISFAYSRFRELFHAKPLTQIVRIEIATGKAEVIHEDYRYMSHENTSPSNPDIMTFCHEGPWHLVEQRIWGLNIQTGEVWKIRSQEGQNVAVGHEYWFADGEHIGYHGRPRDGQGDHVYGRIRWDNSNHVEVHFPFHSTHFQSLDASIIVGDGTPGAVFSSQGKAYPFIQLFKWDGERYVGPHILAYHRSTFNDQHAHCHPRFTPDGKSVLYTSDLTKYSNMYLVEVGDFDDLPLLTDNVTPRHT